MTHEKKHLPRAVILEPKTRLVGFNQQPIQDDTKDTRVSGLPAPSSSYPLRKGRRWVDA